VEACPKHGRSWEPVRNRLAEHESFVKQLLIAAAKRSITVLPANMGRGKGQSMWKDSPDHASDDSENTGVMLKQVIVFFSFVSFNSFTLTTIYHEKCQLYFRNPWSSVKRIRTVGIIPVLEALAVVVYHSKGPRNQSRTKVHQPLRRKLVSCPYNNLWPTYIKNHGLRFSLLSSLCLCPSGRHRLVCRVRLFRFSLVASRVVIDHNSR